MFMNSLLVCVSCSLSELDHAFRKLKEKTAFKLFFNNLDENIQLG